MRWLYKLEYKYGKYCIKNLMTYIVAGMAIVYMLDAMLSFDLFWILSFFRPAIFAGQIWRVVTFIFLPVSPQNPFLMIITLYCYYMLGNMLESIWGSFKFNVYYLIGFLATIFLGFLFPFGFVTNISLNSSLFLAIAAIMPDAEFKLFFMIPLKAKWIALLYFVFGVPGIINSFKAGFLFGIFSILLNAVCLANFFLFFGRGLISAAKEQLRIYNNRRNWNNHNKP